MFNAAAPAMVCTSRYWTFEAAWGSAAACASDVESAASGDPPRSAVGPQPVVRIPAISAAVARRIRWTGLVDVIRR
jgi:hypothetical protein